MKMTGIFIIIIIIIICKYAGLRHRSKRVRTPVSLVYSLSDFEKIWTLLSPQRWVK